MKFGKYLVVDVVSQTARGSVSTARPAGGPASGPATFAVKQFKLSQVDPDEPHWELQHFLDRARIQKSVVASGGRYWVAIHDMGMNADGAWVVSDYLPLSAEKVIAARMELHVAELHHIVDSVVRGLVELQQVRRRAHGGLKPTNVLIAGGSDLSAVPVQLSDPAQGISEGETGDLFALGNLIHQLVLHRAYAGPAQWPLLASDEAWKKLGKSGEQWRELCSALLAPQAEVRPSLYDVSHQLRELTPKKKKPAKANTSISRKLQLKKRHLLAPATLAGIALGGVIAFSLVVSASRRQVAQAKAGWIDAFAAAVGNPERRARYRSDPDLKVALDDLDRSGLATLPVNGSLISDLTPSHFSRLREAAAETQRLQRELSPDHWHRVADLVALQQKYQSRGWNQPAGYLSDLIVAAQPRAGADVAGAIDRIFNVQPLIRDQQVVVEKDWGQIDAAAQRLDSHHDHTLQSFAQGLKSSVAGSISLADDGFHGLDKLSADVTLAGKLVDATRGEWPGNIDAQRLAQDLSTKVDLANPDPKAMSLWLQNLPLYSVRKTETALAAAELRKRLKDVDTSIAREGQTEQDRQGYARDKQEAEAQLDAFAKSTFVERELEDGSFNKRQDGLAAQIDLLRRYSRPQTPADLLKALPSINSASAQIQQYWDAWKKAQLARAPKTGDHRAEMASLKVQAETLHTTLQDVDRQFPPVPKDLSDAYRAVAQKHRDREIAKLLGSIGPKSAQVDVVRLTSAGASYGDWCAMLEKLSHDFPIRKSFVTVDDRPDERWSLQESFWKDPDIQQLVKPDLARLAAVRELGSADRASLVNAARSAGLAELAFEAWRQLGQIRIQPAWPANPQELAIEAQVRVRLAAMLAKVPDKSDRDIALEDLKEQGPLRWSHAAQQADSEAALAAAWNARGAFGVGPAQFDRLPAEARYNLCLWRVKQDIASNNEQSLRQSVDQLVRTASQLTSHPEAAALASALSARTDNQPFAQANPGDRFKVELAGVTPPVEFKRVEPARGRPFYLSTTDVSVAQFVAVVDAAGAWDQCRQLPWAYLPGERDLRRGPRTWEWTEGPFPKLVPPQLWLASEADNDFAPELRAERFNRMVLSDAAGGMPSTQHPIQYVSAETALWFANLCGCRLPTSDEWLAAYQQYERSGTPGQWNLRDRTWELQREYAAGGRNLMSPGLADDGSFHADQFITASIGRDAPSRPDNDGTLFFRPVNAPGGAVFSQLVGNVAQYVCDAREPFESLPQKCGADAIEQFVRQAAQSLHVIGGSALSSPELPVNRPLPLPRPDQGYSDVGFRLAFTAPPRSLSERARWALEGRPYLWPGHAAQ